MPDPDMGLIHIAVNESVSAQRMLTSSLGRHQRPHFPLEGGKEGVEDFRSLGNIP